MAFGAATPCSSGWRELMVVELTSTGALPEGKEGMTFLQWEVFVNFPRITFHEIPNLYLLS